MILLMRRRILLPILATMVLFAAPADAASSPVRTCQEAVARAGAGLVAKVVRIEQACLRKVLRGRLPADTRCVGIGGDIETTTPAIHPALRRAMAEAEAVIRNKCAAVDLLATRPDGLGVPAECPAIHPSCAGAIADFDAAVACQLCTHVSAAQYVLAVQHPGAEATPDPNATPKPTATPGLGGSGVVVSFEVAAAIRTSGFKFHVGYPGAKGEFRGANEFVQCRADTGLGFVISNHQPNHDNLITLIATGGILGLPSTIACTFDVKAGKTVTADDFTVIVDEVVKTDATQGDPNDLHVATSLATQVTPCLGGTAVLQVGVGVEFTELALTIGYPSARVSLPGTGDVAPRVGISAGMNYSAEDVDTDGAGGDDAVEIVVAQNESTSGLVAEVHFDCLEPLTAGDAASFSCNVDAAANGPTTLTGVACTVTRLGFP